MRVKSLEPPHRLLTFAHVALGAAADESTCVIPSGTDDHPSNGMAVVMHLAEEGNEKESVFSLLSPVSNAFAYPMVTRIVSLSQKMAGRE